MLGYYLDMALRSLRRNVALTALMIAAVGVGIGASMTMLTTLRAMSGDPIPDKESKLFVPQIDTFGRDSRHGSSEDRLPDQLSYGDAMALMRAHRVVSDEVKVNTLIGVGVLAVCLINAIGLMLAKLASRAVDLGIRRALGGSRRDIFLQCVTETALVGLLGGLLGLALTAAGLAANRALLAPQAKHVSVDSLTQLDTGMVAITLAVAVLATICAGLYPTWRASRVQAAWQLKAQ